MKYAFLALFLWIGFVTTANADDGLDRALRDAALFGRTKDIQQFIGEGANVNGTAPYGETALWYATVYDRTKAIGLLLANGANPNLTDDCPVRARSTQLRAEFKIGFRVDRCVRS